MWKWLTGDDVVFGFRGPEERMGRRSLTFVWSRVQFRGSTTLDSDFRWERHRKRGAGAVVPYSSFLDCVW
jgi:hypothetical protein